MAPIIIRRTGAIGFVVSVVVIACGASFDSPTAALLTPPVPLASLTSGTGVSNPITNGLSGSPCVTVANESNVAGTQVQIWNCYGSPAQTFGWMADGSIRAYPSTTPMCLTSVGSGKDGDPIQIQACSSGSTKQKWTATAAGEIRGLKSKCLDVFNATPTNGTKLVLWNCYGSASQRWDNSPVIAPPDTTPPPPPPPVGIPVAPGQSIQAAVDANPSGSVFLIKSGTHLSQTVTPKDSDTFRGEVGTVLDGQNVTQFAFKGHNGARWVNGVTVRNLSITKYAPPAQNGAIWGGDDATNATTGWVLDSLDVSYSSNLGVRIGNRMKVLRSNLHHNGTVNIGGIGKAVLVDGTESAYGNNGCPNNPGFESGGSKFVKTDSLTVRNSFFHHNCGVGLWLDIDNINALLENNRVEDNVREGVAIEISFKTTIRNNSVSRNGVPTDPYRANGWLWDAGIGIHASQDVEVYGNTLDENYNGIAIIQQPRDQAHGDASAPAGGYIAQNNYVHDNTMTQRVTSGSEGGSSGAVTDMTETAIFTSRNNRWVNNTYNLGTNPRPFAWMNGYRQSAEWRGYGQDVAGIFNP